MKTRKILAALIAVGVIAVGASFASADTISVNLRNSGNDNNSVDVDETAGVVPISGTYWNNITVASGEGAASYHNTSTVLKDDQGNATAATLTSTLQSGDGWSNWSDVTAGAARGLTGDAGMMQSNLLYDVQVDGGRHLEVSGLGLPFTSGYDVYLYFEADTTRKVELKVTPTTGSPASAFGADSGDNSDVNNDGIIEWKQATGTSYGTANSANYAKLTGLTAPGFAIDLDADGGRGILNGFQIVGTGPPPPPPASTGIAFIDVNGAQGTPSAPDANGNYWNAITSTGSTVNLVDTINVATGWDVEISTVGSGGASGFSGVGLNNTVAAPGPYDIQEAYADGWYDNTPGKTNGQVSFSGLDNSASYRLTLWGNRSGWNNGTVSVTAGTPGGSATLLQNALLQLDIVPDASNNITFTMDEIAGGGAGGSNMVLSLMSIEKNDPQVVPLPSVAEIVGINFMRGSSIVWTQLNSGDSVGVIPSVNWNNIDVDPSRSFGPLALSDASGAPMGVMILSDINAGWDGNNGNGNATPDHKMMNASIYYDNGDGTDTGRITISDLPARFTDAGYDVYLYFESDRNDREMAFTIDGGQIAGRDAGAFSLYTLAAGPGIPANYMVWHNLTGSSFTIDATSDPGRAGIAGIQIVPHASAVVIPEPATMCAVALAVAGLGGYVRKRRKA